MRVPGIFFLLLALFLAGCASEGGVTGTGLSASLAGNVSVTDQSGEVEVSIDGRDDLRAVTDADGNFEIEGEFAGDVTVEFVDSSTGERLGDLPLNVPPGSTTVLEKVVIAPGEEEPVRPEIIRQLGVFGRVALVECDPSGGGILLLDARQTDGGGAQIMVRLLADTRIGTTEDTLLNCAELSPGNLVEIQGVQLSDRTIVALVIVRVQERPMPRDVFQIEASGSVNGVNCERGVIQAVVLSFEKPIVANVGLTDSTRLLCGEEMVPCRCEDIRLRDFIFSKGFVSTGSPAAMRAEVVVVLSGPVVVSFEVDLRRARCSDRELDTRSSFGSLTARFIPDVDILCGVTPCECSALNPGDVLQVVGSPIVTMSQPFLDVGLVRRVRAAPPPTPRPTNTRLPTRTRPPTATRRAVRATPTRVPRTAAGSFSRTGEG
jgi:hypothetical protein